MFCSLFLDTKQFVLRLLPQTVEDDDLQQETVVINRKNLLETLTLKPQKTENTRHRYGILSCSKEKAD